ncbi:MAG: hypothetical protein WB562_06315 [Candidatus Sulfotelmatobacter sp.]
MKKLAPRESCFLETIAKAVVKLLGHFVRKDDPKFSTFAMKMHFDFDCGRFHVLNHDLHLYLFYTDFSFPYFARKGNAFSFGSL